MTAPYNHYARVLSEETRYESLGVLTNSISKIIQRVDDLRWASGAGLRANQAKDGLSNAFLQASKTYLNSLDGVRESTTNVEHRLYTSSEVLCVEIEKEAGTRPWRARVT